MQFEKKFLTELNRCYATGQIEYNGERLALLATEGEGACFAYAAPDYDQQRIVWSAPGGTMSFVPLSGTVVSSSLPGSTSATLSYYSGVAD